MAMITIELTEQEGAAIQQALQMAYKHPSASVGDAKFMISIWDKIVAAAQARKNGSLPIGTATFDIELKKET